MGVSSTTVAVATRISSPLLAMRVTSVSRCIRGTVVTIDEYRNCRSGNAIAEPMSSAIVTIHAHPIPIFSPDRLVIDLDMCVWVSISFMVTYAMGV